MNGSMNDKMELLLGRVCREPIRAVEVQVGHRDENRNFKMITVGLALSKCPLEKSPIIFRSSIALRVGLSRSTRRELSVHV